MLSTSFFILLRINAGGMFSRSSHRCHAQGVKTVFFSI